MADENPLRLPWRLVQAKSYDGRYDPNAFEVVDCTGYLLVHRGYWGGMDMARLVLAAPDMNYALTLAERALRGEYDQAAALEAIRAAKQKACEAKPEHVADPQAEKWRLR